MLLTLLTIEADSKKQWEIFGIGQANSEMGEDFLLLFHRGISLLPKYGLLTDEQVQRLMEFESYFERSGNEKFDDFWDISQLRTHPEWAYLRRKATKALLFLGYGDLALEYEVKWAYKLTPEGEKQICGHQALTKIVRRKDEDM